MMLVDRGFLWSSQHASDALVNGSGQIIGRFMKGELWLIHHLWNITYVIRHVPLHLQQLQNILKVNVRNARNRPIHYLRNTFGWNSRSPSLYSWFWCCSSKVTSKSGTRLCIVTALFPVLYPLIHSCWTVVWDVSYTCYVLYQCFCFQAEAPSKNSWLECSLSRVASRPCTRQAFGYVTALCPVLYSLNHSRQTVVSQYYTL